MELSTINATQSLDSGFARDVRRVRYGAAIALRDRGANREHVALTIALLIASAV